MEAMPRAPPEKNRRTDVWDSGGRKRLPTMRDSAASYADGQQTGPQRQGAQQVSVTGGESARSGEFAPIVRWRKQARRGQQEVAATEAAGSVAGAAENW